MNESILWMGKIEILEAKFTLGPNVHTTLHLKAFLLPYDSVHKVGLNKRARQHVWLKKSFLTGTRGQSLLGGEQ